MTENEISQMTLEKFINSKMTIKLTSEKFKTSLWFCSGKREANQIEKLESQPITFTGDELNLLLRLNPDDTFLENLLTIKRVLNQSGLIKASFTMLGSLDVINEKMRKILNTFGAEPVKRESKEREVTKEQQSLNR